MKSLRTVFILGCCLLWVVPALASNWRARIVDHSHLPSTFLAVDKDRQAFTIYSRQSPLRAVSAFPCTTGQRPGDKEVQGDLRTPEGVYFIEGRLHRKLDWELYGNLAYSLNYPNPIDKLKGKTGYGIWLHGRGRELVPRDTRGCVALNTPDLAGIGNDLSPGLPVVISTSVEVDTQSKLDDGVLDQAVDKVQAWAKAWENRSDEFFSFYDPKRYSLAQGESFTGFKNHKKGLFRRYDWIRVMAHDIRVVPGPGYVVTYFKQYYRTPSMVSEGVKRLYWMPDEAGELRIVGREWTRTGRTLDNVYLERIKKEVVPVIESWRQAWERADIADYIKYYDRQASQGERHGAVAIGDHKRSVWAQNAPAHVGLDNPHFSLVPEGVALTLTQKYKSKQGYEDKGIKTMVLVPTSTGWKIIREDWRVL